MENDHLNWEQEFIATNFMAIAYNAWAGYLSGSRGVVVCSTHNPHLGITGETFSAAFVPRFRLAPFLNAWLSIPDTRIVRHHFMNAHILEAVDTYCPETEVIFLLESGNQVTFFYLKHLPLTPPECYDRISRMRDEFHPSLSKVNS